VSEAAQLSVVLVAPSGMASIGRTMAALRAQTIAERIELLLVTPTASEIDRERLGAASFSSLQTVEVGPILKRGEAAAAGVRAASCPLVTLVEDHAFPEPGWAAAMLDAHAGPWVAVGPAVENANPDSAVSRVVFWLSYIALSGPQAAGPRKVLAWHNSSYKRDVLEAYGDRLGELLEWEGNLQADLRSRGYELYLEPAARTHHVNVSRGASALPLHFTRGRIFGGTRAEREHWPSWRRGLYVIAVPLFPIMQWRGVAPELRRAGVPLRDVVMHAPLLVALLTAMAAGEAVGYLAGVGDAVERLETYELERDAHLRRRERRAGDALER
jgi:hypothetical protein